MARFIDGLSPDIPQPFTLQCAQNALQAGHVVIDARKSNFAYQCCLKALVVCKMNNLLGFSAQMAVDYVDAQSDKAYVGAMFQGSPVLREALDMLRSMAGRGAHHSPKLGRLTQIIRKHFATNDQATRAIVFTSYRDSVRDIVSALREVTVGPDAAGAPGGVGADPPVDPGRGQGTITGMFSAAGGTRGGGGDGGGGGGGRGDVGPAPAGTECRIKVAEFIGQGDTSRGGGAGGGTKAAGAARGGKGQSQKEQKAVLDAFRHGSLNTIVATSIGEEGLDIPAVDLIVFFDVVDTIRTIQRMGRTGRARDGRVVVLARVGASSCATTARACCPRAWTPPVSSRSWAPPPPRFRPSARYSSSTARGKGREEGEAAGTAAAEAEAEAEVADPVRFRSARGTRHWTRWSAHC
jgi:Fanconi anemia group M protein